MRGIFFFWLSPVYSLHTIAFMYECILEEKHELNEPGFIHICKRWHYFAEKNDT
jgi:hypothetical protein